MTKPGPYQPSPDHHPALRHAPSRGDENDAYSFNLVEGADFTLEDGKSAVLTQIGWKEWWKLTPPGAMSS